MSEHIYKVIFQNNGQLVELYARQIAQGGLFGFIEVEDLIFGTRTKLVVDPGEESLQRQFEGVRRFYIPMHAVIRIDEVEKEGVSRVVSEGDRKDKGSSVRPFPVPVPPTGGDSGKGPPSSD